MAEPRAMTLEEFKSRVPLAEVVGRYVRLVRRGREYQGLCPFHEEKSPSFTVVEDKGFYHCFGCGHHGTAIDFVMALEGLDFPQAIQRLADLTGLPAPTRSSGQEPVERSLIDANEAAARWFAARLETKTADVAKNYLERRGLDVSMVQRFQLGYAPDDRNGLRRALLAEGFKEQQLVEAGLLIRPDDGRGCYDRFRHRLMFPIHDRRGRIVGFGGRTLGEAKAKYVNTPETPVFHKGGLLYGLPLAQPAARKHKSVVVAEGYMDVIAFARAGIDHAVAPLGTAVTEAQLALLWQLADEPLICLDGDEAGLRAGHKLIERALPHLAPGKSLGFALLPKGQDPDDLMRHGGAQALHQRLDDARPLIAFLWDSETRQRSLDTPERQAALRQRLAALADSIRDRQVKALFRQASEQLWRARFGGRRQTGRTPPRGAARSQQASGPERSVGGHRLGARLANPALAVEKELLVPILDCPQILPDVEEELAGLTFANPPLEALRQEIISWYSEVEHLDCGELRNHLCDNGFATLIEQMSAKGAWAPADTWSGEETADVLANWRARLTAYWRSEERRAGLAACAEAFVSARDDEARVRVLTVDRLFNGQSSKKSSGGS